MLAAPASCRHNACAMPSLQIRDLPDDLYDALQRAARQERRSLAQQAVTQLRRSFEAPHRAAIERKNAVLERAWTERGARRLPADLPAPAELIRADRDRNGR